MLTTIISSSVVLLVLGILFGFMLGYFKSIFNVEENPLVEKILSILPGANCGACGYPGCYNFSENLANNKASIDGCRAGGEEVAKNLSLALGISYDPSKFNQTVAIPLCQGGEKEVTRSSVVSGDLSCKLASKLHITGKLCHFCCVGLGDCVFVCPVDAIKMSDNKLPLIDPKKCISCGICVDICPRNVLEIIPKLNCVITLCKNRNISINVRHACTMGCITCLACEKKCPQKAITIVNNLPVINKELCNFCEVCVTVCPTKSIVLIQNYLDKLFP